MNQQCTETDRENLIDGMCLYDPVDPYTLSISSHIRNNRRRDAINNVDKINSVPYASAPHRPSVLYADAGQPNQAVDMIGHSSQESTRSLHNRTHIKFTNQNVSLPQALNTDQKPPMPNTGRRETHQVSVAQSVAFQPHLVPRARSLKHKASRRRLTYQSFLQIREEDEVSTPSSGYYSAPTSDEIPLRAYVTTLFTTVIPRQIYLHSHLRLPYMYFSRVNQIFKDAHLTMEEIKEMAMEDTIQDPGFETPEMYLRLKKNWERFIDSLMREWKTLNIISGLLLSGILTIFQIDGAQTDPITRYMAFWSLLSALFSLLYGCFFIIRFSGMRRVNKAAEWAIEAQRTQTMLWNVWVMLAMPAIWLVWSIFAYIACIMAFMWRVRPEQPGIIVPPKIGPSTDAAFRIFICCVFGVGVIYAILIVNTLRHYGSKMDNKWAERIAGFRRPQARPRLRSTINKAEISPGTALPRIESHLSSFANPGSYSVVPPKLNNVQVTSSTPGDINVSPKLHRTSDEINIPPASHATPSEYNSSSPTNTNSVPVIPSKPLERSNGVQTVDALDPTLDEPNAQGKSPRVRGMQVIPPTPTMPQSQPKPWSPQGARDSPTIPPKELLFTGPAQHTHARPPPDPLDTSQILTYRFFSESRERLSPESFEPSPHLPESYRMSGERIKGPKRKQGLYSHSRSLELEIPNLQKREI